MFDVTAHANYSFVEIGGAAADPRYLAQVIRSQGDFNGQAVRLIACFTGNGGKTSFAQRLANELGTVVQAPTGYVRAFSDGTWDIVGFKVRNGAAIPLENVQGRMISYFPQR